MPRKLLLAFALLLPVTLISCGASNPASTTTPAPPNSPQTQALNITKTLADSINAAVKTAIAMRDQGKISPAVATQVENWAASAAILDDQIATELGSSDSWTIQKQKLLPSLAGFKLPQVTSDPTLQSALAQVQVLIQQLLTQVQSQ